MANVKPLDYAAPTEKRPTSVRDVVEWVAVGALGLIVLVMVVAGVVAMTVAGSFR